MANNCSRTARRRRSRRYSERVGESKLGRGDRKPVAGDLLCERRHAHVAPDDGEGAVVDERCLLHPHNSLAENGAGAAVLLADPGGSTADNFLAQFKKSPTIRTTSVRFLDSVSAGKPGSAPSVSAPAAAFAVNAAARAAGAAAQKEMQARGLSGSAQLAAEIAAARGSAPRSSASNFLDAMGVRVASAYGVDHRLKREEAARQREGAAGSGGGVPASGWRRATELEEKLAASERDAAASRLQVGLLREEVRRKGTR